MPTQRTTLTTADLRRIVREHEELERRLYAALISDHITGKSDVYGELWDYAEQMAGCIPEDEGDDYGYCDD